MWMINVRMRRVEEIQKGNRWNPAVALKQYRGLSRTWMLLDTQVHETESEAIERLLVALHANAKDRQEKLSRLEAEISEIQAYHAELVASKKAVTDV